MAQTEKPSSQLLLSLPGAVVAYADTTKGNFLSNSFLTCDPPGMPLGSGGGTAHLLAQAWRETGNGLSFRDWLRDSKKLIVHGGGQSRRLPSYAGVGKPLIPVPMIRHTYGQCLDQSWLDVQVPYYERILSSSPDSTAVMITSGDVLLRFGDRLPACPSADMIAFGMSVDAEQAQHFGVFFSRREEPEKVEFFLQKPDAEQINTLAPSFQFLVDTGMWLLSEKAAMLLMELCGWDEKSNSFKNDHPDNYELYASFGLSLGCDPKVKHPKISELSSAVIDLPSPEFYHLGTSRQIIETFTLLQNQISNGSVSWVKHPDQFIQNSVVEAAARKETNHTLWIENSFIPSGWKLDCEHVLTGVPANNWKLKLDRGVCLDFIPVGDNDSCIRGYGIDDSFSGAIGAPGTLWFGRPASDWFSNHGINLESAGVDPNLDIQNAPIFPVVCSENIDPGFVEWLFAEKPELNSSWLDLWMKLPKISANEIRSKLNMKRLLEQRAKNRVTAIERMYARGNKSIFHRMDLKKTAKLWIDSGLGVPGRDNDTLDSLANVHDHMFRASIKRGLGNDNWQQEESTAFSLLRDALLDQAGLELVDPKCCVLEDQIVWGRSPARLDLAGGWSDTPPYCLEHGGRVVNVAVDLNGQPPIQVFARRCKEPEIVIRSIDLGVGKSIHTYEELDSYAQPGSEFALAKAVLAVSGFLPRFNSNDGYSSLEEQLKVFGGGIQLSLLAAIPQGSGLGTSSILTATLLGVISELCGLQWDKHEIINRTMAVEQMLTTGGGWQDQSGAVFGGIKLLETIPGLHQKPVVRWLPDYLFGHGYANERVLLYYTGITRLAKNILQEIVRGMFLNARECLDVVRQIHCHADFTFDAIQRNDYEQLCSAVHTSWKLNQQLDSGTNPPEVQDILDRIGDDLAAAKLLGAGGGGYLMMFAKDASAGERIRRTLQENPTNSRARFVDMSVSQTGLEITRS